MYRAIHNTPGAINSRRWILSKLSIYDTPRARSDQAVSFWYDANFPRTSHSGFAAQCNKDSSLKNSFSLSQSYFIIEVRLKYSFSRVMKQMVRRRVIEAHNRAFFLRLKDRPAENLMLSTKNVTRYIVMRFKPFMSNGTMEWLCRYSHYFQQIGSCPCKRRYTESQKKGDLYIGPEVKSEGRMMKL